MKILVDVPNDSNPAQAVDLSSANGGHTFLNLTKTNGTNSVTKSFGFYPEDATGTGLLSISMGNVGSSIHDNGASPYDASYEVSLTQAQFNLAVTQAQTKSVNSYNLVNYNCTTYAVSVFNGALSTTALAPGDAQVGPVTLDQSPSTLYTVLQTKKANGTPGITIEAPNAPGTAPAKTGVCP